MQVGPALFRSQCPRQLLGYAVQAAAFAGARATGYAIFPRPGNEILALWRSLRYLGYCNTGSNRAFDDQKVGVVARQARAFFHRWIAVFGQGRAVRRLRLTPLAWRISRRPLPWRLRAHSARRFHQGRRHKQMWSGCANRAECSIMVCQYGRRGQVTVISGQQQPRECPVTGQKSLQWALRL